MKKKILLIGMGGTIASESTPDGLAPELTPEQLLRYVPSVSSVCDVDTRTLFSIDSTDITPAHWLAVAGTIQEHYAQYDGFVISHGTDTMAYTAAALSYLIQQSPKPIILTGAQKPINFENTDSKINLTDAFVVASADSMSGVHVVFNGDVILGTRARKTRSKNFRAFSSINYPLIANVQDGYFMQYLHPNKQSAPVFYETLGQNVGLVKLIPIPDPGLISYLLETKDALIIESFGVGGLPAAGGLHQKIREAANRDKLILMTTQVENEGSDIGVYHVGHALKGHKNILEAYDMTTECVLAKTMWILGQTKDPARIKKMFYEPVAMDLLRWEQETIG